MAKQLTISYRFDISEGALHVMHTPEMELPGGVNPADVYELSALLLGQADVEVKPGLYQSLDCNDWDRADYKSHAKWLLSVVTASNADITTPTEQVYERAFYLGIGPEPRRIKRRFGPLWKFHDELGFEGGYSRGKYDDWSTREFVEYGRQVVKGIGNQKPSEEALHRWFTKRKGPSPALIRSRIGGIGRFQELLGFPYIADWSEDDYIEYGVKVALANPGVKLTRDVFDELSRRKRGPSTRSIVNHFDKLGKFQELISQEAVFAKEQRELWLSEKVNERKKLFEHGLLPEELEDMVEGLDERQMIQQTGVFLLVRYLLKDTVPLNQHLQITAVLPKNVISSIRSRDPSLSAGAIEVSASQLGLFDDIWPMDDYLEDLKVVPKPDGRKKKQD